MCSRFDDISAGPLQWYRKNTPGRKVFAWPNQAENLHLSSQHTYLPNGRVTANLMSHTWGVQTTPCGGLRTAPREGKLCRLIAARPLLQNKKQAHQRIALNNSFPWIPLLSCLDECAVHGGSDSGWRPLRRVKDTQASSQKAHQRSLNNCAVLH